MSLIRRLFRGERERRVALAEGQVIPEAIRCIQCGICSYNCPVGIDVRSYAWRNLPVTDSHCIRCGECVERCPRGTLRLAPVVTARSNLPTRDCLPFLPEEG